MSESAARGQTFTHLSIPQAYEAYLAPPLFAPWAGALLDFVGVRAGAAVLDVASGAGIAEIHRTAAEGWGDLPPEGGITCHTFAHLARAVPGRTRLHEE